MVVLAEGEDNYENYAGRVAALEQRGIIRPEWGLQREDCIDKGTVAYMVCRILNIRGGLNLMTLGSLGLGDRRYALRELVYMELMSMAPAFLMMCVIPFGGSVMISGEPVKLVVADVGMGVLLVLGASSLTVYGLALGGWSSGSKYSLMGGLRSTAQMVSYELSLGLAVVGVLLLSEDFSLWQAAMDQSSGLFHWYIFRQPLGFLIFLVAIFAETNRLPFDLPEADSELVSGYHTEYSSMKFAFFFMGEYAAMVAGSAMIVVLFLGGWHFPGMGLLGLEGWTLALCGIAAFVAKTGFFLLLFIWVRWTLPRFRYDQLMNLGWKVLLPAGLLNVLISGLLVALGIL